MLQCVAYMLSPVCPSVRSIVTWVDHTKTVEVRIMEFSSYGSPIPLVFAGEVLSRNSKGFPRAGASNERGVGKISKTVEDTAKVTINDY